jgi:hypothetical protein
VPVGLATAQRLGREMTVAKEARATAQSSAGERGRWRSRAGLARDVIDQGWKLLGVLLGAAAADSRLRRDSKLAAALSLAGNGMQVEARQLARMKAGMQAVFSNLHVSTVRQELRIGERTAL